MLDSTCTAEYNPSRWIGDLARERMISPGISVGGVVQSMTVPMLKIACQGPPTEASGLFCVQPQTGDTGRCAPATLHGVLMRMHPPLSGSEGWGRGWFTRSHETGEVMRHIRPPRCGYTDLIRERGTSCKAYNRVDDARSRTYA